MKPVVFLLLGAFALGQFSCRRNPFAVRNEFDVPMERTAKEPAKTADVWLERVHDQNSLWNLELESLYPELPPQAEWPKIIEQSRSEDFDLKPDFKLRLEIFATILANDGAATEAAIRNLILSRKAEISEYDHNEMRGYIYRFAKDSKEAETWLKENFAEALKPQTETFREIDDVALLLKNNKIDEAIAELWHQVEAAKDSPENQSTPLGKLVKLGRLLEKPELEEKAFSALLKASKNIADDEILSIHSFGEIINELNDRKDWKSLRSLGETHREGRAGEDFQKLFLIGLYHLEGPKAFLKEFQSSPRFGISDLKSYLRAIDTNYFSAADLGELVVRSQFAEGKKTEAETTLRYLLALRQGDDTLYRLAIEFFPETMPAYFEKLRGYNPYEERPLIWLAEVALGKGDAEAAHKLIDEAIALDPSDGEQGKDTRMQAYDVLSRIHRAKGDAEKADFFQNVTLAIRRGEAADDYLNAGLIDEALRRYKEALGSFEDAYCLQSRLAKALLESGKFEEAKVHYEKAFELMPLSFGPVESHCFGCEQIFEDERVKQIAAATFRRIIATSPKNPRVHYLLGLLLEDMNLKSDAILSFKTALKLDPKYYNCALRLYKLLNQDPALLSQANEVLQHLIKIAPYSTLDQHFTARTDLAQAWIDAQTPPPNPLNLEPLPLPFKPAAAKKQSMITFDKSEVKAIDGWTPQELLSGNSFLEWIDRL